MEEAIKNFPKQFLLEPQIKNLGYGAVDFKRFAVGAMGGSALAADLLRFSDPYLNLITHRDYGLCASTRDRFFIACSYSGNTEEVLDFYKEAKNKNFPLAAISVGGQLLELADRDKIPYIQIPDTGIQPRMSIGFILRAISKLIGLRKVYQEIGKLSELLDVSGAEGIGKELSQNLFGKIPIIYSSNKNLPVAYIWKIKFNETAKTPAFVNVFPELNHNEMNGFGLKGDSNLRMHPNDANFSFIFLEDENDDPRILKRMRVTKKLFEDREMEVKSLKLEGQNKFHKIFQSLLVADWAAYFLASQYRHDPENVQMVEEFKGLIK